MQDDPAAALDHTEQALQEFRSVELDHPDADWARERFQQLTSPEAAGEAPSDP